MPADGSLPPLPDGKLYDYVDNKERKDTPEEYVRQNIERRLVLELGYPPQRIAVEFPIPMGSGRKKADLAIFPADAPHTPQTVQVLIECKREEVKPGSRKDGVGQLKSYMEASSAEWGLWTNGKQRSVWRLIRENGRREWSEPNDIPGADGDLEVMDRPRRQDLLSATADNLKYTFRACHDTIYTTDGLQEKEAFFELLKVIFCKTTDERNIPAPLEFFATAREKASADGRLTVTGRIGHIFERVKKQFPAIFDASDALTLQPNSLARIVGMLQRYTLLDTGVDVKGLAYEEIVDSTLRGKRGQYFTPRNVQAMTMDMLDPRADREEERILDPACGTGGFLVAALNGIARDLRRQAGGVGETHISDRIKEIARSRLFGIDINPELVRATKMNMVMNNDGAGHVYRQDSLLHPHEWEPEFRETLARELGVAGSSLRGPETLAHFDIVVANPPFGSKLAIKGADTLDQYQLARVWREGDDGRLAPTDELQSSQPPEILFIERCWQFLKPPRDGKPGGRMGIVLPDGILGNPKLLYVRRWILTHCDLVASVDLHPDTFQPKNGTQTSVLILQKLDDREIERRERDGITGDREVFMAEVRACGQDKRGNATFLRDEHGDPLFFPAADTAGAVEPTATGEAAPRPRPAEKRRDDDTPRVADEFLDWKRRTVLGW